jgi:hypothetical protein
MTSGAASVRTDSSSNIAVVEPTHDWRKCNLSLGLACWQRVIFSEIFWDLLRVGSQRSMRQVAAHPNVKALLYPLPGRPHLYGYHDSSYIEPRVGAEIIGIQAADLIYSIHLLKDLDPIVSQMLDGR